MVKIPPIANLQTVVRHAKKTANMNEFREQMLKDRENNDIELFEKIKNNPKPDILDLLCVEEE